MTTQMLSAASAFAERDFEIGNTHFRVHKLLPMRGFQVLEMIRSALGGKLASVLSDTDSGVATVIVGAALSLPPEAVERISAALYERVEFARPGSDYMALTPATQPMAFEDIEPVQIYELLIRCLAVNFTASWDAILSRIREIRPVESSPAEYRNVEPFFGVLLEERIVNLPDLKRYDDEGEPLVSLADCCDLHEVLMRRAENERLAHERAQG